MTELAPELELPRGISPPLLIEQVRNTAPFIFDSQFPAPPFIKTLRARAKTPETQTPAEYFELCLSAHFATVATFVPTDVDVHIRFKLWHPNFPTETLVEMARIVQQSYEWDTRAVSTRWITAPSGEILQGHSGEWFSVAAAAYGALRRRSPEVAADIAGMIVREVQRHAKVYTEFRSAKDGIGTLKAATLIAHNLGDLDRVIEQWNIPDDDALKEAVFRAGHEGDSRFGGALVSAGKLNKTYMAHENHRHFALRKPRCLRKNAEYLIPIGPFFDGWGEKIAKHPGLSPEDVGEIAEALVEGWEKLSKTEPAPVGYARALAGILETFPGGFNELSHYVPARIARTLKAGSLRTLSSVSRKRFEDQWNQILSRASC